ncbi:hypothetical protein niasHS_014524 [Heterodera schachtii]|uniref:Dendritic cell-specific transmembrane protein-like domain-containing protein n=1 Tax=Heterodera schachtii TaxID=97005 RepID=A0ABD2I865_HETSC
MTTALLWDFYMEKREALASIQQFDYDTNKLGIRLGLVSTSDVAMDEDSDGDDGRPTERGAFARIRATAQRWKRRICTRRGREQLKAQLKRLKDRRPKDKRMRTFLFLFGLFMLMQVLGTLYYFIIALKYPNFAKATGTYVGIVVHSILFLLIAFRPLRFLLFVALPKLMTGKLRNIIVLMMLIWGFQYPAQNATGNIETVIEGVACVAFHIKEAAQEMKDLANTHLYKEPLEKMREFLREQSKPFDGIRQTLRQMDESLTKMLAWQRALTSRIKGLMTNCTDIAQLPFRACVGWLSERHTDCLNRFLEFLCMPIDWAKHLCYITKMLQFHCIWPSKVKGAVKEGVGYFVKGAKQKITDYARETFMYDMYNKTVEHGKLTFETLDIVVDHEQNLTGGFAMEKDRVQIELKEQIKGFNNLMDAIVLLLNILMIFFAIWPFLSAFLYIRAFMRSDKADNRFIGKDFIKIDEARALTNQPTVLPLMQKERKHYLRITSMRMTRRENISWWIQNIFLGYSLVPVVVFVAIDVFIYRVIKRAFVFFHGNTTVFPTPSIYKVKVAGDGFLNQLLAGILRTFEPIADSDRRDRMWRTCFKEPSRPNYELFQICIILYLFCILLITAGIYLSRVRHLVALHYLPERAHPRAMHLYNKIMANREDMMELMVRVKKKDEDIGQQERQMILKGLAVLTEEKLRCHRCSRVDLSVAEASKIRLCPNCNAIYCIDCFTIRKNCMRKECRAPLQALTEDIDFYVDSSCEEDDDEIILEPPVAAETEPAEAQKEEEQREEGKAEEEAANSKAIESDN